MGGLYFLSVSTEAELLQQQKEQMEELRRKHEIALDVIDRELAEGIDDERESEEFVAALKEVCDACVLEEAYFLYPCSVFVKHLWR